MLIIKLNSDIEKEFRKYVDVKLLNENGSLPYITYGEQFDGNSILVTESSESIFENTTLAISGKPNDTLPKDVVYFGLSEIKPYFSIKDKVYTMRELSFEGDRETCDAVMGRMNNIGNFTLSINLNVLDKSFSDVGVPGGMTPRQLIYFIQRIRRLKSLKGIELLELDKSNMCLAAKLVRELS